MDYINHDLDIDVRGVVIFACSAANVWGAIPLQIQVETRMINDHYPYIFDLARLDDDHETSAVVLATGQEARIMLMGLSDIETVAESEAPEKIKRFQAGGTAQMLFQRRTDNLIKAHMKDVGKELDRLIRHDGVRRIVFAGNDAIKGIVLNELPDNVKALMLDYINLDPNADMNTVRETVDPIFAQAEREQEANDARVLEDRVATKGGLGVAGVADTALALSKGQVHQFIALQSFNDEGGECTKCGMIDAGAAARCPYCGGEMRHGNLRELFALRAVAEDAEIQMIESSDFLNQHGGVGALLRYRDDVSQEQQSLSSHS
jgi:peptide subunit release factor 1 (eRF1)